MDEKNLQTNHDSAICHLYKTRLNVIVYVGRLTVKGWKKIYCAYINQKKAGVSTINIR